MSIGCWNIRGLNDPLKQEVGKFIKENRLSICGLVETKVRECNALRIGRLAFGSWETINNYDRAARGRICCGWDAKEMNVFRW